jgi:CRP-like cAMP-binding protein
MKDPKQPETTPHEEQEILKVLRAYLDNFSNLTDEEFSLLRQNIHIRRYAANTMLVEEGQPYNTCIFVLKGLIRQYTLKDGIEKTTHFFTEGQPVSTTFMSTKEPSRFTLVCAEDTIVIEGNEEESAAFLEEMPQFEHYNRVGVEYETKRVNEQWVDFVLATPEERYENLLQTRPDLFQRVPLHQIASLLGITPESLSRIRKRLTKKQINTH